MEVLKNQRLIEPQVMFEASDVGGRDVRVLQVWGQSTARRFTQNVVEDQRNQQKQRYCLERPPYDVIKQLR